MLAREDILTMPSKQQDVAGFSPVLFMTVDGEPMSFYLRPGPAKRKLQPLITAGGGTLSSVQKPGAILLIYPEERSSIPESSSHWYVSTQYIHDCIEKNEQLNLEDYRLNPVVVQRSSARLNRSKESSPGLSGGRLPYTHDDDVAILKYVSKHKTETGGNRLWQQMEKQHVTNHSWQSMKHRYKVLAKKQLPLVDLETTQEENKDTEEKTEVEENQETDVEEPSCKEDVPLQAHSADSDLTQIDVQSIAAQCKARNVDAETSISFQEEEQHVNQQTEEQPAESIQAETVEAETSDSPQTEGLCPDHQTDTQVITAETTEPDRDEPQTPVSPQKQSLPEEHQPAQPESTPKSSSSKKPKERQKASPMLEQPQRRISRRQLELEASLSPEPYAKKLRSSLTVVERPMSSPQHTKKTKSAVKSALQKDAIPNQPPSKKAREESVEAVAESQLEQTTGDAPVSETPPAVAQKSEKKKEKRKLGILELATKEFEDESESDKDPDVPDETAATSTEPGIPPRSDSAADPAPLQFNPKPASCLQENMEEPQASRSNSEAEASSSKPAVTEPAAVSKTVNAASKAHLFIFDSESQEDDSQSLVGAHPAAVSNPELTMNKDAAFSMTQTQLEEDKQRIRELMNQTDQDLVSVTKALLKTSGDFAAALDLLLNPSSISGPFWNRCDDNLLLSGDPVARQQLQEKYGEEDMAKRIMFLEVEG